MGMYNKLIYITYIQLLTVILQLSKNAKKPKI